MISFGCESHAAAKTNRALRGKFEEFSRWGQIMTDLSGAKLAGTVLKELPEEHGNALLRPSVHPAAPERGPKVAAFRPRSETPPVKPVKIAIKTKGKILLIHPGDILAVEAEGNYVLLRRAADSYLLRESISTMAEKLEAYGFVRIHRSVLVNASSVEELHPGTSGEYMLRIAGGRQYMVSRTYKNNLKSLAHAWIGTGSFVEE
jgi:DNA-binding LytR/AlgR family response regulator